MNDQMIQFYQSMQMANALSSQQATQQLQLAITAKTAQIIMSGNIGNGGADVVELISLLKGLGAQSESPPKVI